jgi:uncharacterized protein
MVDIGHLYWLIYAALAFLAVYGALIFAAARRGWMRHGYFTTTATIVIVIGIFILFQGVGAVLVVATGGLHGGSNITLLAMNGIAQLGVMLVGTVLLSLALRQDPYTVFRLHGFYDTPWLAYVLAIPIMFSAQIVGEAVATLWTKLISLAPSLYSMLDKFESASDKQMEGLVTAHGLGEFVLIFLFVALVPAFAEETLFRGFAMSNIEHSGTHKRRPYFALAISSILFASIHLSVFKLPGLLALGLALGYMALRTNNLFVGSLGHAANNGLIVMALYLKPNITESSTTSSLVGTGNMTSGDALLMLAGSLPSLLLLIYAFNRVTRDVYEHHSYHADTAHPSSEIHLEE